MPINTYKHEYKIGDEIIFVKDYKHLKIKKGKIGVIMRNMSGQDDSLVRVKIENEDEDEIFECCAYRIKKIGFDLECSNHRLTSIFK